MCTCVYTPTHHYMHADKHVRVHVLKYVSVCAPLVFLRTRCTSPIRMRQIQLCTFREERHGIMQLDDSVDGYKAHPSKNVFESVAATAVSCRNCGLLVFLLCEAHSLLAPGQFEVLEVAFKVHLARSGFWRNKCGCYRRIIKLAVLHFVLAPRRL